MTLLSVTSSARSAGTFRIEDEIYKLKLDLTRDLEPIINFENFLLSQPRDNADVRVYQIIMHVLFRLKIDFSDPLKELWGRELMRPSGDWAHPVEKLVWIATEAFSDFDKGETGFRKFKAKCETRIELKMTNVKFWGSYTSASLEKNFATSSVIPEPEDRIFMTFDDPEGHLECVNEKPIGDYLLQFFLKKVWGDLNETGELPESLKTRVFGQLKTAFYLMSKMGVSFESFKFSFISPMTQRERYSLGIEASSEEFALMNQKAYGLYRSYIRDAAYNRRRAALGAWVRRQEEALKL